MFAPGNRHAMICVGPLTFVSMVAAATVGAAVAPAQPALVPDVPVRDRPGFTVSFGLGYGYGILGAQLRYDRPLRPWLHVAPFVAVGMHFGTSVAETLRGRVA